MSINILKKVVSVAVFAILAVPTCFYSMASEVNVTSEEWALTDHSAEKMMWTRNITENADIREEDSTAVRLLKEIKRWKDKFSDPQDLFLIENNDRMWYLMKQYMNLGSEKYPSPTDTEEKKLWRKIISPAQLMISCIGGTENLFKNMWNNTKVEDFDKLIEMLNKPEANEQLDLAE